MGKQMRTCLIAGSAPFEAPSCLKPYAEQADMIIAADGGQHLLAAMGVSYDWIVGDFDSSDAPKTDTRTVTLPTEKDDTDVLAAIRIALDKGFERFILIGCLGGRLDHTLANVFLLRFLHDCGAVGTLVDENQTVTLLGKGTHDVIPNGARVFSLLPYGGDVEVSIDNAKYTLDNATLDTAVPLGVSNEFLGNRSATVTVKKGFLLLIITKKP